MKPVSLTAYYCTGVRMEDATRWWPICGDHYARLFMNERGLKVHQKFRNFRYASLINAWRHRFIDDWLRGRLCGRRGQTVLLIGAGFDSRAWRLKGGRWIEVDEPALMQYKEERLPAVQCPNSLTRLSIEFDRQSLADLLTPHRTGDEIVIVIEGVLMYLPRAAIHALLDTLQDLFPRHRLWCDLMTRSFFRKYAAPMYQILQDMGARFQDVIEMENPESLFLSHHYHARRRRSISGQLLPAFLSWLPITLNRGYNVWDFEFTAPGTNT